jgi:hypothetical protein
VIAVTGAASAASITWVSEVTIAFGSTGSELSTDGTVLYAIDPGHVGDPNTIGTSTFVDGPGVNVPYAQHSDMSGYGVFDGILDTNHYTGATYGGLTLTGLTVGKSYQVELIQGHIDEANTWKFGDGVTLHNATYLPSTPHIVTGTFTADAATQSIQLIVPPYGTYGRLNAYVVRDLTPLTIKATVGAPNGVKGVQLDTDLTWAVGFDAVNPHHTVYIDSGSGFVADADLDADDTDGSHTPTIALNLSTTYSWYVATNADNGSQDSDVWSFTTRLVMRDISQWDFEGDLTDSIGTNDGTAPIPVYAAEGIVGSQSLVVTPGDANSVVTVPLTAELNSSESFTIEAWVKPAALLGDGQFILSNYGGTTGAIVGGYCLYIDSTEASLWVPSGSTFVSVGTPGLTVGQWNYIVATYDNGVATVYLNGEQGDQDTNFPFPSNTTNPMFIGAGGNFEATPGIYFDGAIDQVKISTIIPDAIEIAANYVASFPDASICLDQTGLTYDLDGNCAVDLADIALIASEWLNCNRVSGTTSTLTDCR